MVVGTEVVLAVRWLAAVLGLGTLALALTGAVFRDLEGRGAGLAIPLALAVVGLVGFWVGRLSFGRLSVAVAVLALGSASALSLRRGVEIDPRRYAEVAAVFTIAFAFLLAVRAIDPGVVPWGGEKYLDYGLLTGLSKAETLPPEDPWFAGEPVRYYYGGHLLAASLARLTATPPHYAYNLALAATYATLVSAAYGLAGAIAASRGIPRLPAALLGAFLVGVASNLATPVRLLAWLVPAGRAVLGAAGVPMERAGGETVAAGPEAFGYWDASRLIPGTINEFPLFAFLNGDLHAHMLATPFLLLAVGLCLAYWETPAGERWRRRLLVFVALPAVVGWLAVVNAWDLPTTLGLGWLTLALAPAPPHTVLPGRLARRYAGWLENAPDGAWELGRPLLATVLVAVAGAGALAAVAPFLPTLAGGASRSLAVAERSPFPAFLLVHGAFLAVAYRYLAARVPVPVGTETVALAVVLVVAAWAVGLLPILTVVPVVALGWLAARRGGFEALLLVAGAGIVATVELVYLADPAGPGRLNTVFKSYVHVWILWAVAGGVALSWLLERAGSGVNRDESPRADVPRTYDGLAVIGIVLLVATLSIYGGLALSAHVESADGLGLDARADLQETEPDVATAVDWLAQRDAGSRIVEAPTPPEYTYGTAGADGDPPPSRAVSGASTFSGLPTLAGWTHAADYHGEEAYRERVEDAATVFEGSDDKRAAVLAEYDVTYVYVGPNERAWYDLALEDDDSLSLAAEFGEVRIYEVEGG